MTFSISPAQENICVRPEVYCGKERINHPKCEPTPLALKKIAERVAELHKPIGAKGIV